MVSQETDGTVQFSFFRPNAKQVSITGEFNGWHKTSMPMTKGVDGWWRYRFRLAPGVYQFRYLSDGQWFTDYAAFGLEPSPFGWNSVLKVDQPAVLTFENKPQVARTAPAAVKNRPVLASSAA